jgi:hypothetical protein
MIKSGKITKPKYIEITEKEIGHNWVAGLIALAKNRYPHWEEHNMHSAVNLAVAQYLNWLKTKYDENKNGPPPQSFAAAMFPLLRTIFTGEVRKKSYTKEKEFTGTEEETPSTVSYDIETKELVEKLGDMVETEAKEVESGLKPNDILRAKLLRDLWEVKRNGLMPDAKFSDFMSRWSEMLNISQSPGFKMISNNVMNIFYDIIRRFAIEHEMTPQLKQITKSSRLKVFSDL